MKKYIAGFALLALVVGMASFSQIAKASGEKVLIEQISQGGNNTDASVYFMVTNGSDPIIQGYAEFPSGSYATEDAFNTAMKNSIVTWGDNNSFPNIVASDVFNLKPILAPIATSGSFSDLGGKPTSLSGYGIADGFSGQYWHNGALQSSLKHITFSGTTTSGTVVFYLTNDGTSGGSALCSSTPKSISVRANDPSNTFGLGYAVTNSNKTLTVTANARSFSSTSILGIGVLGSSSLTAAANGTAIDVAVDCN